jgi:MFS family permease
MRWVTRPGRDALLIYAAGFLRSWTVGLVGVILAIHLAGSGLSVAVSGLVISAGLAGAAAATLIVSVRGDRFGRRRTLIVLAVLSAGGYIAVASTSRLLVLMPLAFLGTLNGMGRDRGAAYALEQAILPETAGPERRTWLLAWYNLVLDAGHAFGALAGMAPAVLMSVLQTDSASAHRLTFLICAAVIGISVVPYTALSRRVEVRDPSASQPGSRRLDPQARSVVRKLAFLFGLDSLAGGFLTSALVAYWFFKRYGFSERELASLFFTARLLNAGSHVAAAWISRRIGLVNTMVFTHLPSSLFLMAAPVAASGAVASALFLAREALVEMDVPTRQSYVMALVGPGERTFASGVTNVTRNVGWAVAPSIAGLMMQQVVLAGPLFIGGTLKIAYDLLLYRAFRHVRPPEEKEKLDA